MAKLAPHPFVSTPNDGPCSSCGKPRSSVVHNWDRIDQEHNLKVLKKSLPQKPDLQTAPDPTPPITWTEVPPPPNFPFPTQYTTSVGCISIRYNPEGYQAGPSPLGRIALHVSGRLTYSGPLKDLQEATAWVEANRKAIARCRTMAQLLKLPALGGK